MAQAEAVHATLATFGSAAAEHTVPQPSQLAKPALQVMPHTLAAQVAVPLVELQTVPQAPQLVGLVVRSVSQPLLTRPSQLPQPALQVMPQTEAVQLAVPLVEVQTLPQA